MNRIFLVDDHAVFRKGMNSVIDTEKDLEVCGSVGSAKEALELIPQVNPGLVISDLSLPDRSGIELIKELRQHWPKLPVLIVSLHDELFYAERVLRAGGRGYLMKEKSEQLLEAIRTVLAGQVYVAPSVLNHFIDSRPEGGSNGRYSFPLARLSARELEVFALIGKGSDTGEIASQLQVSERTVDAHRTHIRTKLGLGDSNALLRYAVRWVQAGKLGQPAESPAP
jgi:DNA-binding NarL/FixJ family response regulator